MQKGEQGKLYTTQCPKICPATWILIIVQAALVTYFTAGYPTPAETVDIMLGMEAGGSGNDVE